MQAVVARKEEVTEKLRQGIEQLMAMPGITFVRGEARLLPTNGGVQRRRIHGR